MIRRANKMPYLRRIPTGSYEFDFMCHDGIPINRVTRLWGGESSGKSLLAFNVIRNAQNFHIIMDERLTRYAEEAKDAGFKDIAKTYIEERDDILKAYPDGMDVAYYNIENNFDPDHVKNAGIDMDRLIVVDESIIETIGETMENLIKVGVDLHVLDSTTSAIPLDEFNMDMTEHRRGLEAKRWSLVLRRCKKRFLPTTAQIQISQVRIEQNTGSEYAPGGKAMDHAVDLYVHMHKGKWLYRDKNGVLRDEKESQEIKALSSMLQPDGTEVSCRVNKSRVGRPFLTARTRLDYANMKIDLPFELKEAAIYYGLIERKGAWYECPDGSKHNGESKLRNYIAENMELQQQIKDVWFSNKEDKASNQEVDVGFENEEGID